MPHDLLIATSALLTSLTSVTVVLLLSPTGNLPGEIWIGNTKEETHKRLIRPSTKIDELLFEEREEEKEMMGSDKRGMCLKLEDNQQGT